MRTVRCGVQLIIALFAAGSFFTDAELHHPKLKHLSSRNANNKRQNTRRRHRRRLVVELTQKRDGKLNRRIDSTFEGFSGMGDDDSSAPARLIIDPLTIVLQPVVEALMPRDIESILSAMENAIFDYLRIKKDEIIPAELVFVRLGNTLYNGTHGENNTASIHVDKGVASFTGPPLFTKDEAEVYKINSWIQESLLSFNLVDYLYWLNASSTIGKVSDNLLKVRSVTYEFLDVTPPPSVVNQTDQPISDGIQSESKQAPFSGRKMGTIVSFTLLGFVLLTLLALLIVRKQRRSHAELEETESGLRAANSGDSDSVKGQDSPTSALTGKVRLVETPKPNEKRSYRQPIADSHTAVTSPTNNKANPNREKSSDTSGSLVSSDGQWTMPTEDGDTSVLKPIRDLGHAAMPPRHASLLTPAAAAVSAAAAIIDSNSSAVEKTQSNVSSADSSLQNLGMATADSFELERHVNVRKDMLVSAWASNSRAHPGKVNAASSLYAPNQSITVLQPSYFSASQEHRARHAASAMQTKDEFHLADIEAIMNNPGRKLLGVSTSTSDEEDEDDGTTDESTNAYYYQDPHRQTNKNDDDCNSSDDATTPVVTTLNHPKNGMV